EALLLLRRIDPEVADLVVQRLARGPAGRPAGGFRDADPKPVTAEELLEGIAGIVAPHLEVGDADDGLFPGSNADFDESGNVILTGIANGDHAASPFRCHESTAGETWRGKRKAIHGDDGR